MKIDFIRKITSRKLWMAIVGFVTGLLTLNGVNADQIEKIGGLIMMGASVIAYIIGEGLVDSGTVVEEVNELSHEDSQRLLREALEPPDEK
jgi:hypothetical protein